MENSLEEQLQKELEARDRYNTLLDNPNITSFTPRGTNNTVKVNDLELGSSPKKLLKGLAAKRLKTSTDVLEYLKDKKVPLPVNDKVVLYIFEEDEEDSIVETTDGMLIMHSDTRQIVNRRMGDRDQTEERVWQRAVVVGVRESFISDSGKEILLEAKVGDIVALGFYAGADIAYDGVRYKVCMQYDIICKLPE